MKTFTARVLLLAAITFSVCSADAAEPLDKFTMKDQARWNCAKTIAIALFPVAGDFKGKRELGFYQKDFADKLADRLRNMAGVEKVDVVSDATNVSADILIDGKFVDLTTGSRALRFWVGFGAGKSFCRADMKGIDPGSGTEVFILDHARGSAMDIISDDELIENINEVVEDVAAGLMAARGTCPANGAGKP